MRIDKVSAKAFKNFLSGQNYGQTQFRKNKTTDLATCEVFSRIYSFHEKIADRGNGKSQNFRRLRRIGVASGFHSNETRKCYDRPRNRSDRQDGSSV